MLMSINSHNKNNESALNAPLWKQLQVLAECLISIRNGQSGTDVLNSLSSDLRPAIHSLLFYVLRHLGIAEAIRDVLVKRRPPPEVDALLCCALALACNESDGLYTVFTLVNQSVESAKRTKGIQAQASFINGCLRRFLREKESLLQKVKEDPVARWNHPLWWIRKIQKDHVLLAHKVLTKSNEVAPITLRVNVTKCTVEFYEAQLKKVGIAYRRVGLFGIQLQQLNQVKSLPGFDDGWFSVQDAGAQLAAPLLLDKLNISKKNLRLLDACAAPGGKTAHLLEYAQSIQSRPLELTALDIDPLRVGRIYENLTRLGLEASVHVADAAEPQLWQFPSKLENGWDAILLDAPCTASGIVRRHPDIRWLRRPSDIASLANQQQRLLNALWPLLRSGGYFLYCTCSLFKEEGDDQIKAFLEKNADAELIPAYGHLLPTDETVIDFGDHDSFFYALLRKQ
jgi:16S rRNA (cytosine967-C5)-methyltransferase